jgi:hypothetical protein
MHLYHSEGSTAIILTITQQQLWQTPQFLHPSLAMPDALEVQEIQDQLFIYLSSISEEFSIVIPLLG